MEPACARGSFQLVFAVFVDSSFIYHSIDSFFVSSNVLGWGEFTHNEASVYSCVALCRHSLQEEEEEEEAGE